MKVTARLMGFIFLILGIATGFLYFYPPEWRFADLIRDFYANLSTTFIGTAITVLVIDTLNQQRQDEAFKAQLIKEICSTDKDFALRLVRQLSAPRHLPNYIFQQANLR